MTAQEERRLKMLVNAYTDKCVEEREAFHNGAASCATLERLAVACDDRMKAIIKFVETYGELRRRL